MVELSLAPFSIFCITCIEDRRLLRYNGDNRMWNTPLFSVRVVSVSSSSSTVTAGNTCLFDTFLGQTLPLFGGLHCVNLLWFGLLFIRLLSVE